MTATATLSGLASIYHAIAPSHLPRVLDWQRAYRPMVILTPISTVKQEPLESQLFFCSFDDCFYIYLRLDDCIRWYRSFPLTGEALERVITRHVAGPAQ